MKEILRITILVVAAFAIGLIAGNWMRSLSPLPPPPFGPLGDIRSNLPPWADKHGPFSMTSEKAAEIQKEMDKLRPEMEAFKAKLEKIEADFRTKFDAILTPEQRKLMPELSPLGKPGDDKQRFMGGRPDEQRDGDHRPRFRHGFGGPLEGLAVFTIITPAQQYLTETLKLSDQQQATLKQLLLERRQKFLELVDTTPPPSLKLGRLMAPPNH